MPEGVSDNIDFRFHSIGNGEPVKFVNRGGEEYIYHIYYHIYARKINFAAGFEGEGVRRLARIFLSSR